MALASLGGVVRECSAVVLALALSSSVSLACDLGSPSVWDSESTVTDIAAFDFVTVVRFDTTQRSSVDKATRQSWVDDVPSDTIGVAAICDRVQLETPLPLSGDTDLRLTMMQGERLHPDTDLEAFSALSKRVLEAGRFVKTKPGPVYVAQTDQSDPNWRPKLLAATEAAGDIDPDRWMIGLPGGLYLVPIKR